MINVIQRQWALILSVALMLASVYAVVAHQFSPWITLPWVTLFGVELDGMQLKKKLRFWVKLDDALQMDFKYL